MRVEKKRGSVHYGYARISLLNSEETTVSLKYGMTFRKNRTTVLLRSTTYARRYVYIFPQSAVPANAELGQRRYYNSR